MPEVWWAFRRAVERAPTLDIGRFVQAGCRTTLPDQVCAAYDAPFPDESYKAGPRAMPGLVPVRPDDDSRSPVAVVLIGQPTLRRRLHQGALAAVDQRVHRNGGPGRAERSLLAA